MNKALPTLENKKGCKGLRPKMMFPQMVRFLSVLILNSFKNR